jgi:HEAT repeat protein
MNFEELAEAIASGNPGRARPALASLVDATPEQAEPLLLLGLQQQSDLLLRQLSCAGLGRKPTPAGWNPLVHALEHDPEVAVRAEAANALVSHSFQRAWPLVLEAFEREKEWLLRCSVLSAVAEHPDAAPDQLFKLAEKAITDADGTVRVGGAEILGRLMAERSPVAEDARERLGCLQTDVDHRVVAVALNSLQSW